MQIYIDDNSKLRDIQEAFSAEFPYLRMEFFIRPEMQDEDAAANAPRRFAPLSSFRLEGMRGMNFYIGPDTTVAELVGYFRSCYALGVQVWRKSGKVWLETRLTEDWSLEEQNRQGHALSTGFSGGTDTGQLPG